MNSFRFRFPLGSPFIALLASSPFLRDLDIHRFIDRSQILRLKIRVSSRRLNLDRRSPNFDRSEVYELRDRGGSGLSRGEFVQLGTN